MVKVRALLRALDEEIVVLYSDLESGSLCEEVEQWYCENFTQENIMIVTLDGFTDEELVKYKDQDWYLTCHYTDDVITVDGVLPPYYSQKQINEALKQRKQDLIKSFAEDEAELLQISSLDDEDIEEKLEDESIRCPAEAPFTVGKLNVEYMGYTSDSDLEYMKKELNNYSLVLNEDSSVTLEK